MHTSRMDENDPIKGVRWRGNRCPYFQNETQRTYTYTQTVLLEMNYEISG